MPPSLIWWGHYYNARRVFRYTLGVIVMGALLTGAGVGVLLANLGDDKTTAEANRIQAEAEQIAASTARAELDAAIALTRAAADIGAQIAAIARAHAETEQLRAAAAKLRAESDLLDSPANPED